MDPGAMERETIDGVVNVIVEFGILRNSFIVCIAKDCGAVYVRGQREALLGRSIYSHRQQHSWAIFCRSMGRMHG
jgi:hypothetical protein